MKTEIEVSEADKEFAKVTARHLATNYMNAVWDMSGQRSNSKDRKAMEKKYDEVCLWVVKNHEKQLTNEVLKFLRLKGVDPKEKRPNFSRAFAIVKHKTIGKAKKKIRKFLYE